MNRKIGMIASIINVASVVGLAISMLFSFDLGSYFFSMFIAYSFIPFVGAFTYFAKKERKLAGYTALVYAGMYAVIILLVYFAQLTTVRINGISDEALALIDYQKFGLFFNYDLLGYGLMALATFFVGLTIEQRTKAGKWLKGLLMGHGVFFISCLIIPMLGVFKADGGKVTGILILEFWCAYFIPIGLLSFHYFSKKETEAK